MSLSDFMRQLEESQGTGGLVYSKPPEKPVRVIPPERASVRLIPPTIEENQPKVLKIKINKQAYTVPNPTVTQPVSQNPQTRHPAQTAQTAVLNQQPAVQQQQIMPPQPVVQSQPVLQSPPETPKVEQREKTAEELFLESGTEIGKKEKWLEVFAQARRSKKTDPVIVQVQKGRFMITPDDHIANLPNYDVVGKDPDDILKDKWF